MKKEKSTETHIKKYYEEKETARKYDEKRFTNGGAIVDEAEKRAVAELAKPRKGMKILDVASGTGRFARFMAGKGASVTAFDYSAEMLEISRELAENEGFGNKVVFKKGDAGKLPFRDNEFDASASMRFLIHTDDPEKYFAEMARVTSAGGPVVFDTINSRSIKAFEVAFANLLRGVFGYSYMSSFSAADMRRRIDAAGLEIGEERKEFFFPQFFYRKLPFGVASGLKKIDDAVLRLTGGRCACAHYWKIGKPRKNRKK